MMVLIPRIKNNITPLRLIQSLILLTTFAVKMLIIEIIPET